MNSRVVVSMLLASIVLAFTSSSATADKGWALGKVTALDETAQSIGAGIAWTPRSCEGAVLWMPGIGSGRRWTFRVPGPCPATSTGRGVSAVAADNDRVVFLSYVGGNTREWRLWTATTTSKRPRLLRFASADAGEASPIVLGNAGEEGIPYAVGRDVVVLDYAGARVLTWRASDVVTSLSESANLLAATLANGDVVVVQLRGAGELLTVPAGTDPVTAVRPFAGGVAVATAASIDLYRPNRVTHLDVPAGAKLAGFFDGQLVYVVRSEVRMHAEKTGTDVLLRRVFRPSFVDADRRGMAWSVGSTLCWTVRAGLTYPFAVAPGCQ